MTNKRILLFLLFFMLATLISESPAKAVQINNSIDQAIAMINNAIDEAIASIKEALDNDPAQARETIKDALAQIRGEIDRATDLIEEVINDEVTLIEETIEEDFASTQETINRGIQETIEIVADRLGEDGAVGLNEIDFTGSIIAGRVSAYELIGDNAYKISAELAGENILSIASSNFKGDELFALARLSQISSDPNENPWWTALCDFYQNVQNSVDGTEDYISQFASAGPSTAVFNLAYFVITAYYVDTEDKEVWRRELINYLAQIDNDSSDSPVMVLGIATWALALTGELDDTLLDTSGTEATCWNHRKKLKDLPTILLNQQVPNDELYAGSFYRQFDHDSDGMSGLPRGDIEDTIFATLGLIGAYQENPSSEIEDAIISAYQVIVETINAADGSRYHRSDWMCLDDYRLLAAEILQVIREMCIPIDLLDYNDY